MALRQRAPDAPLLARTGTTFDQRLVLAAASAGRAVIDRGRARHREIRAALDEVTARLFGDFPPEDLATAGRLVTIVMGRANAELARPELPCWP